MVDWRTADTLMIDTTNGMELGRMAHFILKGATSMVERSGWRRRPLLTALSIRRFMSGALTEADLALTLRVRSKDSLEIIGLPSTELHIHIADTKCQQSLYWGDVTLIDGLIRQKEPLWYPHLGESIDQLVALSIYREAASLPLWEVVEQSGLNQATVEELRKHAREA